MEKSIEEKVFELSPSKREKMLSEAGLNFKELRETFIIDGKPEPYARARFRRTKKFVQCYNPKQDIEERYKRTMQNQISTGNKDILNNLVNDANAEMYVAVDCLFFVPISENDSVKTAFLKDCGIIKPAVRNGDIDNYVKLVLDAMHGVIYSDDKVVVAISAKKAYSFKARSEINVTVKYR